MSDTTLFRRSYVRGLNDELIRQGSIAYPTKLAADHAADFVADTSGMPDPYEQPGAFTAKIASDLCGRLQQASEILCKEAGGYSPEVSKTAAAADPRELAAQSARELMEKVAYEMEAPNTAEQAARHNEGAALDLSQRPAGYAVSGVGNYIDMGKGHLGVEEPQPRPERVEGSNSAIENSAKSAAARLAAKVAASTGSYAGTAGAPPANTLSNAAKHNEGAALDLHNRPEGYANVGVNASKFQVPAAAVIGHQEPHARANHPSGSNTAIKAASYVEKVANRALPFLFADLTEAEKVAHVRAMSKLSAFDQAQYLHQMYGAYGVKQASAKAYTEGYLKAAAEDGEELEASDDAEVVAALAEAAKEIETARAHEAAEMAAGEQAKEASVNALRAAIAKIQR